MLGLTLDAPVTLIMVTVTIVISVLIHVDAIDLFDIYFNRYKIAHNFEFWRLFTSIFYFGSPLRTFFEIISMVQSSTIVELSAFPNRPVDYLIFLFFGIGTLWICACIWPLLLLGEGLIMYLMYYSSKREPDRRVALVMLPIPMPSVYIPLIVLAFTLAGAYDNKNEIITIGAGFLSAQLYFFLKDVLNIRFNRDWFCAPDGLNNFVKQRLTFRF